MTYQIAAIASTQTTPFPNTVAAAKSESTFCGANTFLFSPKKTFLRALDNKIEVYTAYVDDVGVYNVDLQVFLTSYSGYASITKNFNVTIQCEVREINFDPDLIKDRQYKILIDSPLILPLKFTENPNCGLTYKLKPTSVPFKVVYSNSPNQIKITSESLKDWGSYNMTLEATPLRPGNPLYLGTPLNLNFTLEMIDLCRTTKFFQQKIPNIEIIRSRLDSGSTQNLAISEFLYDAKTI